jgi:hypothetical protein
MNKLFYLSMTFKGRFVIGNSFGLQGSPKGKFPR